ncbi:MAG: hypothetical protein ACOYM4_18550 [Nodosilinea sp.]
MAQVNERWASFQSRWAAAPPQEFIVQQFAWAQQQQQGILGRGWARKETIVFEYASTWGRGAAN